MRPSHREFVLQSVRSMLFEECGSRASAISLRPLPDGVYRIEAELQDGRRFHGRCLFAPPRGYMIEVCLSPSPCSCFA